MALTFRKFTKRLSLISMGGMYTATASFSGMVISVLVIRLLNAELWGSIVQLLLWTGLALNIMSWGNKDLLTRQFSLSPSSLKREWQQSFSSRSLILILALMALVFVPLEITLKLWMILYLSGRFIYLSYDSLVVFKRKFLVTVILELTGFLFISVCILIFHTIELTALFSFFAVAETLKASGVVFYFRKEVWPSPFKNISTNYFIAALPFFIIGFASLLQGKMDLYIVTFFSGKKEIGEYQVFTGFFGFAQLAGALLLFPFAKNIYRLNATSLRKLEARFIQFGALLTIAKIMVMFAVLTIIYQFQFPAPMYLLAYLYILPVYFYQLRLFENSKKNKQWRTISALVIGSLVNLSCSILLIPRLQLEGALLSAVISQWTMMVFLNLHHWNVLTENKNTWSAS